MNKITSDGEARAYVRRLRAGHHGRFLPPERREQIEALDPETATAAEVRALLDNRDAFLLECGECARGGLTEAVRFDTGDYPYEYDLCRGCVATATLLLAT